MGDLRSKADDMIEEYKEMYFDLKKRRTLLKLYPFLSGMWVTDWQSFIKTKKEEAARVAAYENKVMEETLSDTFTRSVVDPPHYDFFDDKVIDIMVSAFGAEDVKTFMKLSAFKYRLRAGKKGDASIDIEKAMNCEKKYQEL